MVWFAVAAVFAIAAEGTMFGLQWSETEKMKDKEIDLSNKSTKKSTEIFLENADNQAISGYLKETGFK